MDATAQFPTQWLISHPNYAGLIVFGSIAVSLTYHWYKKQQRFYNEGK